MTSIALESLSEAAREQVLQALDEPVLVTDKGRPILVVRNLLEDDVADDLIAQHPALKASIQARGNQGQKERSKHWPRCGPSTTASRLGKYVRLGNV